MLRNTLADQYKIHAPNQPQQSQPPVSAQHSAAQVWLNSPAAKAYPDKAKQIRKMLGQ